jgi:hypothetical protein
MWIAAIGMACLGFVMIYLCMYDRVEGARREAVTSATAPE